MPPVSKVKFRILTPLFLGGADQNVPEVRAASFKAALRYWHRAINPQAVFATSEEAPRTEDLLFGGAREGSGQCSVLLRVKANNLTRFEWERRILDQFNEGRGIHARNGLRYLSYPFHMRGNNEREGIKPEAEFEVHFVLASGGAGRDSRPFRQSVRRAWLASVWLLGSVGSLGTRSRRGFGSLEVTNWPAMSDDPEWSNDAKSLPDVWSAQNSVDWLAAFARGKETIANWFGSFNNYENIRFGHPHFGSNASWELLEGDTDWAAALNYAGRKLQDFRVRRSPDYEKVKEAMRTNQPLRLTPERAVFGLPLTFRYSSLKDAGEAQFVPSDPEKKKRLDRHASLLRIRLVRIGNRFHPLFLRLSGATPGQAPNGEMIRRLRGSSERETLAPASGDLLDRFMSHLRKGDG